MVNGVQCVVIDGTIALHKLYAMNLVLVKHLMLDTLHTMDRVVVLSGLLIYVVMILNKKQLETVYIMDGEIIIVIIVKMLV